MVTLASELFAKLRADLEKGDPKAARARIKEKAPAAAARIDKKAAKLRAKTKPKASTMPSYPPTRY